MQAHESIWHVARGIHKSRERARRRPPDKCNAGQHTLLDDLHVTHCDNSASLQMHQVKLLFCFYVSGLVLAGDPCQAILAWPVSEVDLL